MISGSTKISEFPKEFNSLEERVKILEEKIEELKKSKQKTEELIEK